MLNSIRQLASRLGVSPNTVVIAYVRLVAAGDPDPFAESAGWSVAAAFFRKKGVL